MTLSDIAGLTGAFMMLSVYGCVALGWMNPLKARAHGINLTGAVLVLYSLYYDFNLAAAIMEVAWALVAIIGLGRLAWQARTKPRPPLS